MNDILKSKYDELVNNPKLGEQIFLTALLISLTVQTLCTTMFSVPWSVITLARWSLFFLVACKIFLCDGYRPITLILLGFCCCVAVLVKIRSGYWEPMIWLFLVIGAKDVLFQKILNVYLISTFSVMILAFFASMLGVIVNLQYEVEGRGIRNAFGSVYPTDFASHVFFIMLAFLMLYRDKIKKWTYIFLTAAALMVYYFCDTRLDVICMLIAIAGYAILRYAKKNKIVRKVKKHIWIVSYSMPIAALIMSMITMLYNEDSTFWSTVDRILTYRLKFGKQGIEQYGISILGQTVEMLGFGGSTKVNADYFFVDCSYLYVLLRYGLLFFCIAMIVYILICRKYQDDQYFLFTIALIALNCMIAHHWLETAYNPFAMALLAKKMENNSSIKKLGSQGEIK